MLDLNSILLIAISATFFLIITGSVFEKRFFKLIVFVLFCHLILIIIIQADINRYVEPHVVHSKFFNDGEAYSSNGLIIAHVLKDKKIDQAFFRQRWGIQLCGTETLEAAKKGQLIGPGTYELGYVGYLYGIIYAAYGYCPAFINFMNVILTLIISFIIFKMSKDIFGRYAAYTAILFFLFNPTLFYYSTTKLQESLVFLLFYLLLYFCLMYIKKRHILYLALSIPLLFFIYIFKFFYFLPTTIFLSLILLWYVLLFKRRYIIPIFMISIFIFIIKFGDIKYFVITKLHDIASYHWSYTTSGGKVYRLLNEQYEFLNYGWQHWLFYIIRGWYHLILEPIQLYDLSLLTVLVLIYKLVFLTIFIFAVFGALISFKHNYKYDAIFIIFFFIMGSMFALVEGNIGTMIRHRDLVTPILFIYSAYFISRLFSGHAANSRVR